MGYHSNTATVTIHKHFVLWVDVTSARLAATEFWPAGTQKAVARYPAERADEAFQWSAAELG